MCLPYPSVGKTSPMLLFCLQSLVGIRIRRLLLLDDSSLRIPSVQCHLGWLLCTWSPRSVHAKRKSIVAMETLVVRRKRPIGTLPIDVPACDQPDFPK